MYHGYLSRQSDPMSVRGLFGSWNRTVRPLFQHFVFTIAIWALIVKYVDGRDFNVTERRPWLPLAGGVTVRTSGYVLLQSDVTTLVSGAQMMLGYYAASWAHPLIWRGAFFLMEETPGLRREELARMMSWGFFIPRYKSHIIIGAILLLTLFQRPASPVLDGSISWIPSSRLIEPRSDLSVAVSVARSDWWEDYASDTIRQLWTARQAAGLAGLAWGRRADIGVMKRVLRSTDGLNANSTITNVTLPYFSVTALEWISDPLHTLPPEQTNITNIRANIGRLDESSPIGVRGMCTFIPDPPKNITSFPSPSVISETRTLILYTHWLPYGSCRPDNSEMFSRLPPTTGFLKEGSMCFAFARVTYTAGAGVCANCRLSSNMIVQNDTSIPLQEDVMTTTALQLMPFSSVLLVQMNTSIPSTHGPVNDYIVGMLTRSYSGAWTAVTDFLGRPAVPLSSRFSASLPSSRAQVDLKRVYIWLAAQLVFTVFGIVFLLMQSRTTFGLIGDTALAGFELDTAEVITCNGRDSLYKGGLLRLERKKETVLKEDMEWEENTRLKEATVLKVVVSGP